MNTEQNVVKTIPWTKIDDQSIVANPSQNSLILLNQVATKIWLAYRTGYSEADISHLLQTGFQIDAKQANNDVLQTVSHWQQLGLFESYANANLSKPWYREESSCETSVWTAQSARTIYYQLNSKLFCIDYHNESVFDSVHRVLKHLFMENKLVDADLEKPYHLQIDFDGKYKLSGIRGEIQQFDTIDELIEVIQWVLIETAYCNGGWLTVLHSAALGYKNGQAVVFIANRGSGKSTLTRLLQQHNLIYLADDVVPVDYNGALQPMPMCQRFKQGSWKLLDLQNNLYSKTYARKEGLYVKYVQPVTGNTKDWSKSWPVKAIVYPKFNDTTERLVIKKLTNVQSITELCQSSSVFGGAIDQTQLDSIVKWICSVPSYSVSYSAVNSAMARQIKLLFGEEG